MKKILYLLASLLFGYLGIGSFAITINPIFSEGMPSEFLTILRIIGVIGILLMKYYWGKFRKLTKKEKSNEN